MNFWVLSGVSTQYTYFERYRNVWDLMVTLENQPEEGGRFAKDIRSIDEVSECTAYRKLQGRALIGGEMLSKELKSAGGIEALQDTGITKKGGEYLVETPIVVLDDQSFEQFLQETEIDDPDVETVTVNRIWDNINSHFRDKAYLPFLTPEKSSIEIWGGNEEPQIHGGRNWTDESGMARLELMAFVSKGPDLREEFENFSLVQIVPERVYREKLAAAFPDEEMYFKIRAVSEEKIDAAEEKIDGLLQGKYEYQLENRRTEEAFEEKAREGYMILVGTLCGLLAFVGIVNVFANTLGGVYMRRREFARYLSVGFTPGGLFKILAIESCITALKPILISLPFQIAFVIFTVNVSKLRYSDYLPVMPLIPMAAFAGAVFLSVGAAYYMAGRKIAGLNIVEGLKDDTMF